MNRSLCDYFNLLGVLSLAALWLSAVSGSVCAQPPQSGQLLHDLETQQETPEVQLTIKDIVIIGNTALSDSQLQAICAPYIGKTATLTEIQVDIEAIVQALDQLYQEKGYIASGAFSPPQDLSEGIVRIQVVEGALEGLTITGLNRLPESYLSKRLWLAASGSLNINKILFALQRLQAKPLFQSIRAELKPGTSPERRTLKVEIVEAPVLRAEIAFDNYESVSVGENRGTTLFEHLNLVGVGDRASGRYNLTSGLEKLYLNYTIPINAHDGTLRLEYETGNSEIVQPPFDRFEIEGNSQKVAISWRQPVIQTPSTDLALSVTFDWQQTESFLLSRRFSFIREIPDGLFRLAALRFATEGVSRSTSSVVAVRSEFSVGTDWFGATVNESESGRDGRFFSWRGQFQYSQLLAEGILFNAQLSGQLSGDALLPGEHFQIGGIYTVRGYDYNFRRGDSGISGTIEFRFTIFDSEDFGNFELYPFFDFGAVYNSGFETPSPLALTSAGASLRWQLAPILIRLDYAQPFVEVQQQQNLYFSIGLFGKF